MQYKEQVLAIYGISPATQEFLQQLNSDGNVIGLLDGYCQEGELYGKPIISLEEAIAKGVGAIVVVARPSSRRIVVNRIRKVCQEKRIRLYDTEGNDLLEAVRQELLEAVSSTMPKKQLMEQMEQTEVVSFDIFDTLVTRTVLYPSDVFSLVEQRLIEKYGQGFDFHRNRRLAESSISRGAAPNIYQIYKELKNHIDLPEEELEAIRQWEWELEQQVIIPREEVCELFQYAKSLHKKVYLVSDMYYTAEQLTELLKPLGITGFDKLLVSCDYNTRKGQQLFLHLKEEAGAESYLHIGDNPTADVEGAIRNGITGIQIRKGLDMFEAMPWSAELMKYDKLSERLKLGMLIARMFNSPFALENGKLSINKPEDLGYLIVAPLLADFVLWLKKKLSDTQCETALFCARDGYLIQRLLESLQKRNRKADGNIKPVYFLTSRTSAVSAGIFEKQDIASVVGLGFNGDLKERLRTRFLLQEKELEELVDKSTEGSKNLEMYEATILNRSKELRNNYLEYIRTLGIPQDNIAIFDFVSSGTCQLYLEKIMQQKMQGCYFMRVDADSPDKELLEIESFYSSKERDSSKVYEDYFILENIVTSPMPSVRCFDENGIPVYMEEKRSKAEISFIMATQEGIIEYFERYLKLLPEQLTTESDKGCAESIWSLLHRIPIENEIFHRLVWEDNFYSRSLSMNELM